MASINFKNIVPLGMVLTQLAIPKLDAAEQNLRQDTPNNTNATSLSRSNSALGRSFTLFPEREPALRELCSNFVRELQDPQNSNFNDSAVQRVDFSNTAFGPIPTACFLNSGVVYSGNGTRSGTITFQVREMRADRTNVAAQAEVKFNYRPAGIGQTEAIDLQIISAKSVQDIACERIQPILNTFAKHNSSNLIQLIENGVGDKSPQLSNSKTLAMLSSLEKSLESPLALAFLVDARDHRSLSIIDKKYGNKIADLSIHSNTVSIVAMPSSSAIQIISEKLGFQP